MVAIGRNFKDNLGLVKHLHAGLQMQENIKNASEKFRKMVAAGKGPANAVKMTEDN